MQQHAPSNFRARRIPFVNCSLGFLGLETCRHHNAVSIHGNRLANPSTLTTRLTSHSRWSENNTVLKLQLECTHSFRQLAQKPWQTTRVAETLLIYHFPSGVRPSCSLRPRFGHRQAPLRRPQFSATAQATCKDKRSLRVWIQPHCFQRSRSCGMNLERP